MKEKLKGKQRLVYFAVAHGVYFTQFEGLFESLSEKHAEFVKKLEKNGVEVVDAGFVDSSEKGFQASVLLNSKNVDLIMCNMITYATSSVFAPVLRECRAPMILVALQPLSKLDYMRASTYMQLENDNICSVPEFIGVANRIGKRIYDVVIGTLYNDEKAERELSDWCDIAKVLNGLKGARIGLMGHVMEAMYDMHADPTAVFSAFGIHVPLLEIDDVVKLYRNVDDEAVKKKIALIDQEFEMPEPVSDPITSKLTDEDKLQAAKSAVALDMFIEKYNLSGLAYYYEGEENEHFK